MKIRYNKRVGGGPIGKLLGSQLFSKLFEPGNIGSMELVNRIVLPAHSTSLGTENGAVTDRMLDYYAERAKGGVGLVIVEAACIEYPVGRHRPQEPSIYHDKFNAGLNDLAEAIQRNGAKAAIQICHAGPSTTTAMTEGIQPVSPSDVGSSRPGRISSPRALRLEEIQPIVEKFSDAAYRAMNAGFDAVEVHGAHEYLVSSFISPVTNKRTDAYGGNLDNRCRFALEILASIRKKVGNNFPIIFRINGEEFVKGGLTQDESRMVTKRLEDAGVDAINVSAARHDRGILAHVPVRAFPEGCYVHLAEGIKRIVKVPVMTVGRIFDPVLGEEVLKSGKADFICMCRALIADPQLPLKAAEGRLADIRGCIGCNRSCMELRGSPYNHRLSCDVNAAAGKERELQINPAAKSKSILVIGGGPAGMEAARVAALRGHQVTLYEKSNKLGGQLSLAVVPPHKNAVERFLKYLVEQVRALKVTTKLSTEVTRDQVMDLHPDAVVLATGSVPIIPNIPGIRGKKVPTAWDVLSGAKVGNKIIIVGGGLVGCETAEYLAEEGKEVTIVEMLEKIAPDVEGDTRTLLLDRLGKLGTKMLVGTLVDEVTDKGIVTVDSNWGRRTLEAETVVISCGSTPNNKLASELHDLTKVYPVGECAKSGFISGAIHDAYRIALRL